MKSSVTSVRFSILCCLFSIAHLFATSAQAQPTFRIIHRYEGTVTIYTSATMPDGSCVSAGFYGAGAGFLQKTDDKGAVLWARSITLDSRRITINAVIIKPDGSILAAAFENTGNNYFLPVLFCFSGAGDMLWSRTYEFGASAYFRDLCLTHDGGYLLIGDRSQGFYLKTDSLGIPKWCWLTTLIDQDVYGYNIKVIERPDSSFVIAGNVALPQLSSTGPVWAISVTIVNNIGTALHRSLYWDTTLNAQMQTMIRAADGSLLIGGSLVTTTNIRTPLLMKLNDTAGLRWGNAPSFFSSEFISNIIEEPSGAFLAMSLPIQPGAVRTDLLHLFEFDTAGTITSAAQIEKHFPSYGSLASVPSIPGLYSLSLTIFDSLGNSAADISTIKVPFSGCNISATLGAFSTAIIHDKKYNFKELPLEITSFADPQILAIALTPQSTDACITNEVEPIPISSLLLQPNPVQKNSYITITMPHNVRGTYELIMRDITGREVYHTRKELSTLSEQLQMPTSGLASGVYTIELLEANSFSNVWRGKVVVE